jgi:hypothetical protein
MTCWFNYRFWYRSVIKLQPVVWLRDGWPLPKFDSPEKACY